MQSSYLIVRVWRAMVLRARRAMVLRSRAIVLLAPLACLSCSGDERAVPGADSPALPDGPGATEPDGTSAATGGVPTFYQDVGPIFISKCVGCHQEGGIAPFPLNDYAAARARGGQIADYTEDRVMPPFAIATGGECGSFDESRALTPEQIALIGLWGRGERAEGTPTELSVPPLPTLEGGTTFSLPEFTPQVVGTELALFDEYRCFEVDPGQAGLSFITGFDVLPGNAPIVHHVLGFIVDPSATTRDGRTNAEVMQALHDGDPNPERDGWSCFGAAGDGVDVEAAPITWAPGLGVVEYTGGLGVPLAPGRKLVVQVHYNLADSATIGQSDQTRVQLRLTSSVRRPAVFVLEDPLLDSAYDTPTTLAPGQASVKYVWEKTGAEIGVPPGIQTDIVSLFPHMHGLGRQYTFEVDNGEGYECQGHIGRWDFNWQRNYDYTTPLPLTAETRVRVTCDYDTTGVTEPVLPGWGTRNEMCLATLMIALPIGL